MTLGLTDQVRGGKKSLNGGMAERFKAAVLKTAFLPGNGGSNPSPSAKKTPLAIIGSTLYGSIPLPYYTER
jgi:hypothetical protein